MQLEHNEKFKSGHLHQSNPWEYGVYLQSDDSESNGQVHPIWKSNNRIGLRSGQEKISDFKRVGRAAQRCLEALACEI